MASNVVAINPLANLDAPAQVTTDDDRYLAHEFGTWQGWLEPNSGWTPQQAREAVDNLLRGWPYQAASLARHALRYALILGALTQRTAPTLRTQWRQESTRGPRWVTDELGEVWDRQWRPDFETSLRAKALLGGTWYHVHWVDDIAAGIRRPMIKRWPPEAMYWRAAAPGFPGGWYAVTSDSGLVRMVPGDGKWILLADGERWHELGAILSLGELFVSGKLAERDEAGLSEAAGRASPWAQLPEGVPVGGVADTKDPTAVANAKIGGAVQKMVAGLGKARVGAVVPHGTEIKEFQITSDTSFFDRYGTRLMIKVALSILGQTGTTVQGAGGVYTAPVFADVADALVDKDHDATARAWNTGLVRPFCDLNAVESNARLVGERYADPVAKAEADAKRAIARARRHSLLGEVVKAWRDAGLEPSPEDVAAVAAELGARPIALGPKPAAILGDRGAIQADKPELDRS